MGATSSTAVKMGSAKYVLAIEFNSFSSYRPLAQSGARAHPNGRPMNKSRRVITLRRCSAACSEGVNDSPRCVSRGDVVFATPFCGTGAAAIGWVNPFSCRLAAGHPSDASRVPRRVQADRISGKQSWPQDGFWPTGEPQPSVAAQYTMPNIASILKSEISRVARKEVRSETLGLKKAVGAYRTEIAALKRRTQALEQQLRRLSKAGAKVAPVVANEVSAHTLRFSAKGLASQRQRLALSAHDCGLLVGASGQSIYKWEDGKARPRAKHLPAIAALRTLGKKEAAARLGSLRGTH